MSSLLLRVELCPSPFTAAFESPREPDGVPRLLMLVALSVTLAPPSPSLMSSSRTRVPSGSASQRTAEASLVLVAARLLSSAVLVAAWLCGSNAPANDCNRSQAKRTDTQTQIDRHTHTHICIEGKNRRSWRRHEHKVWCHKRKAIRWKAWVEQHLF